MLLTILPFLLAARVAIDDPYQDGNRTQYGGECTYGVLVNMSLSNVVREEDNFCSMIESELKCRPKGSDSLVCRFTNSKVKRPDPDDTRCSNAKNFVPVTDRFVNEGPFEIRFNSKGIENLIVSRDIPRWRLDMIRAIVGQLNVGFDLDKGHQRFLTMENSSIGYCEVEIKMSRTGYGKSESNDTDYEIFFEPERADTVPLDRAKLQIEKVRQPKKCPNRKIYFFGNHEDYSFGNKTTFMDMTSSTSRISIGERELHSYTETTGIMETSNKSRTMRLHQKISLSLKSMKEATDSLPNIINPAATSLYAYTNP